MAKVDLGSNAALSATSSTAGADMMFRLKQGLKTIAATYKVMEASDGTTYTSYRGTGGTFGADVITVAGTGAGGMNNASAWFVLSDKDGVVEIMCQRNGSGTVWTVKVSPLDKFIGGAPNATTPSTATDSITLVNGTNLFDLSGGTTRF